MHSYIQPTSGKTVICVLEVVARNSVHLSTFVVIFMVTKVLKCAQSVANRPGNVLNVCVEKQVWDYLQKVRCDAIALGWMRVQVNNTGA